MTFTGLTSLDLGKIARAEQARRAAMPAPDMSAMTADQRQRTRDRLRDDPREWAAIVAWADWLQGYDLPPYPPVGRDDMARHLAAVTLRTAKTALANWHRDGCPPGDPEARAHLLLRLHRAFAELNRQPVPTVNHDGTLIFPPNPERKAA